jgi:phosphohistidine swiveling domain-containing protein
VREPLMLRLESVRAADVEVVGCKAAGLGDLIEAGFPVPEGICLTAAAFRRAMEPYRDALKEILSRCHGNDPPALHAAAAAVSHALCGLAVPPPVASALRPLLWEVFANDAAVAVRSSATAEDRADASFAGQYETMLGVRGEPAVLEAVLACWRSFFKPHSLAARAAAGALTGDEAMAVLIQRMVEAECAGVCFTVDPIQNAPDRIVVNAAWGLGAGVVDGSVRADTARLRRDTFEVEERRIVEKPVRVALDPNGGDLRTEPVPEDRRRAACLPNSWLKRVAQFGLAAELRRGRPQDVEWAIAGDRVWILQSRPITALPKEWVPPLPFPVEWKDDEERRSAWELEPESDIAPERRDSLPLPMEHATKDLYLAALREAAVYNGSGFRGQGRIPRRKVVNGRGYAGSASADLHDGDLRVRRAAGRDLGARLREEGITAWEYRAPEIIAATERLRAFDRSTDDGARLAEHLEDAFGVFRRHWFLHWAPVGLGDTTWPFDRALGRVADVSEEEAREASFQVVEGDENVFTRLLDGIYALACAAREAPAVAELIAGGSGECVRAPRGGSIMDRLAALPEENGTAAFRAKLDLFLESYGQRSGFSPGSSVSIATPTWREDPAHVLALAAPYIDGGLEPPSALRDRANRKREARIEALCAACEDPEAVAELHRWLPLARRQRADLENHNHYIDQLSYGQLRTALLAAGRWLVSRGSVGQAHDVLWLSRAEIVTALRRLSGSDSDAGPPSPSLADIVAERKVQWAAWSGLCPPPILGTPEAALEPRPALEDEVSDDASPPEEGHSLKGQAASAGRRRGRARVVAMSVRLPAIAPGEVLVAENAGPTWTPLFPLLGGLVLEEGNLLQHAATTAREYGIPAVINTPSATRRIADGAWVTVDGTRGIVEWELELDSCRGGSRPR